MEIPNKTIAPHNSPIVKKAMLLSAGLGTRLKPWTNNHPKALAEVNGKTLLERNIKYLQSHGIYEVVVNVHHFAQQIIDTIGFNKGWGSQITISDETACLLETGGGLLFAAEHFKSEKHILVINVDILTDMDITRMVHHHINQKALATLAVTNRHSSRTLVFDPENRLCGWHNAATGQSKGEIGGISSVHKAFSGIQVLDTQILTQTTQTGKFSIIDIYLELMKKFHIHSYDHSGDRLLDVGKPDSIARAEALFF